MKRLFALLVSAVAGMTVADAADVYISDFSIKAGEAKLIAVNFDSERTDLKRLEGTITLPAGLTVMNQGTSSSYLWMTYNAERTGAALSQYSASTGKAAVVSFGSAFNAGTGAIAYLKVTATTDLASESTITLSDFTATTSDKETVALTTANATVTREAGSETGGGTSAEETSTLNFTFSPAALTLSSGQTAEVQVLMENGMTATGLQADIAASTGLSILSVTKSDRMSGWNYNAANGRVFALGAVTGNEGAVFTVKVAADAEFSGEATLTLSNLAVTTAAAKSYQADNVVLPVTVQSLENVALAFESEQLYLASGESTTVAVTLTSDLDLTGFMGKLVLPEGVTAAVAKGELLSAAPSYNAGTGMVVFLGSMTGKVGTLFTLTLTADAAFTAEGAVKLTGISTTTAAAKSIVPSDISLTLTPKAAIGLTAPVAKTGLVYTGAAQELVTAGAAEGGELQYSLDGKTYGTAIPSATNAGTYTVYYQVVADAQHSDVAPAMFEVTIAKAALTEVTLADTALVYNRLEQTFAVKEVKAGALEVAADSYTVTGNKATAAGQYKATVTAAAEGNFTGALEAAFEVKAAEAATAFAVTLAQTSFVYDGTAKEPAVTVKDGEAVLVAGTDYTVAYADNVEVGTATVTLTALGNYSGTVVVNFTIAALNFAVEAEADGEAVTGVTLDAQLLDASAKTVRLLAVNVPADAEAVAVFVPAKLGDYTVAEVAKGALVADAVTDVYLPETDAVLTIEKGAVAAATAVHTSLALLDDYALLPALADNYAAAKVMTTVAPANNYWTLGVGCDVIVPAEVQVFTVTLKNSDQVKLNLVDEADLLLKEQRVVKANNGVLLAGVAGAEYDLVAYGGRLESGSAIATTDSKSYGTDNLLEPVVEQLHLDAADAYYVLKGNEFHAIKAEAAEVKVPAGKAVLHLGAVAGSGAARVLGICDEATGLTGVKAAAAQGEAVYDLLGRRVQMNGRGLYIVNGKKVLVR